MWSHGSHRTGSDEDHHGGTEDADIIDNRRSRSSMLNPPFSLFGGTTSWPASKLI